MINLKHKKLDVWKTSIELTAIIYEITQGFPKAERYGLISQMRRAAVSVASNIAEGASRSSAKERRRFYEISRSSLVEIDTQLEIAQKLRYSWNILGIFTKWILMISLTMCLRCFQI